MAVEVREFVVTVPHGTAIATPQVSSLAMPARVVRRLRMRFPPGPSGFVGCRFTSGQQQVIPVNVGAWLIGDDELFEWDVSNQITSGAWQLTAYNTGTFDHTLYVTFEVDPPQLLTAPVVSPLLDPDALGGSAPLVN